MNLVLVGLSHRTAPLAVRERFAVAAADCVGMNEKLVRTPELDEAALLSTCNRTELVCISRRPDDAAERLHAFLVDEIGGGRQPPELDHFYELRDVAAVEHLFRVAASLDSMVVGEAQILGQMKQAYAAAVAAGACGPVLNRLFQGAFRSAKRVRSQTGIGAAATSVARVGVQLAAEIFEGFDDKHVLLIGAGEMAESAVHGLREAGARRVAVVNRSLEPARRLADRFEGHASTLAELDDALRACDIALCSLSVERPLLGPDVFRRAVADRRWRPLLVIDLGIPRNVDPAANALDDLYLYDLDDLEQVAERGRERRRDATRPAEAIVARARDAFETWRQTLPVHPTIRDLVGRAEGLGERELERTLQKLPDADPETRAALERLARSLVQKLIQRPVERLRIEAGEGGGPYYSEAVRRLFGLDEDDEGEDG